MSGVSEERLSGVSEERLSEERLSEERLSEDWFWKSACRKTDSE